MNRPLLTLTVLLISSIGMAQEEDTGPSPLESGTIESRFDYVMEKSNRYQGYKVVKIEWLEDLKDNALDSLKAGKNILDETRKGVTALQKEIEGLKVDLKAVQDSLSAVSNEKDNIEFFGSSVKKSSYKSMMWLMVFGLLAALSFFIFRFIRSNVITSQTQRDLSEIRGEFDTYKNAAREKEQKLKRELQDELNKRL